MPWLPDVTPAGPGRQGPRLSVPLLQRHGNDDGSPANRGDRSHLNALWQVGLHQSAVGSRACPSCLQPMRLLQQGPIALDGCLSCQFLWFDAGELQALPDTPREDLAAMQRAQERTANAELGDAVQRHHIERHPLIDWIRLMCG